MARSRLFDLLQDHRFWALDASHNQQFPVFSPFFGFSRISSPSIQMDVETFKDGTNIYPRNVIKGASVGSVTFERAASFGDTDFYDWINFATYGSDDSNTALKIAAGISQALGNISGGGGPGSVVGTLALGGGGAAALSALSGVDSGKTYRRNIMVLHLSDLTIEAVKDIFTTGSGIAQVANVATSLFEAAQAFLSTGIGSALTVGSAIGPLHATPRIPARAWMLYDCIPINYTAASDFDAKSGEISLMSLEVQPEYIDELNFGS